MFLFIISIVCGNQIEIRSNGNTLDFIVNFYRLDSERAFSPPFYYDFHITNLTKNSLLILKNEALRFKWNTQCLKIEGVQMTVISNCSFSKDQ